MAGSTQDVAISVWTPHPLEVLEEQLPVMLPELPAASRGSQPAAVQLVLQAPASSSSERSISLPLTNTAQVVVTFKAAGGSTGAAHLSIALPMCLFCQVWREWLCV
jgi:hypothetical protein